jgi:hypothetical protein
MFFYVFTPFSVESIFLLDANKDERIVALLTGYFGSIESEAFVPDYKESKGLDISKLIIDFGESTNS